MTTGSIAGTAEMTRANTFALSNAGQESYNDSSDYEATISPTNPSQYTETNRALYLHLTNAVEVYGLTKRSEIQAFSCHSLRVSVCCILYATGYSGEFIQRALRWRSEAWKTYVRDLVVVTIQHNKAMSEADTMPLM